VVRDYDFHMEFHFMDPLVMSNVGADPEFCPLNATEGSYVSSIHVKISMGWVETYVSDGKIVNITHNEKSSYPTWVTAGGPLVADYDTRWAVDDSGLVSSLILMPLLSLLQSS